MAVRAAGRGRRADFTGATVTAARFTDCRFDRLVGADGLAGAEIGTGDLMSLAPSLAAALGITIVDASPS